MTRVVVGHQDQDDSVERKHGQDKGHHPLPPPRGGGGALRGEKTIVDNNLDSLRTPEAS